MKQSALSLFLKEHGVTDSTPIKQITQLKREYWKQYQKEYYQERKKKHHRLTLRLSDEEYNRLQSYAQEHQEISFSTFIKESALAYQEQGYIPRDPNVVNELVSSVRKIGRVINQVVQSLHRMRRRTDNKKPGQIATGEGKEVMLEKLEREYDFLVRRVGEIEQEVVRYMQSPPKKMGEVLVEILQKDPSKLGAIRNLLDGIEQKVNKK